jgi:hypothetical protein
MNILNTIILITKNTLPLGMGARVYTNIYIFISVNDFAGTVLQLVIWVYIRASDQMWI